MKKQHLLFFFENNDSRHASATWRGGFALAVFGWLLGFAVSLSLGVLGNWFPAKLSFIFPFIGLLLLVIQVGLGMRRYFLPSLLSVTTGYVLCLVLVFLFNWANLYYFLPFSWWLGLLVVNLILYALMWHYNRVEFEPVRQHIMKLYQQHHLGFEDLDTYLYVRSSPVWIRRMAFWFFALGLLLLGAGRFANMYVDGNAWYTPYGLAWGAVILTMTMIPETVRYYGHIRPAFAAARQLRA